MLGAALVYMGNTHANKKFRIMLIYCVIFSQSILIIETKVELFFNFTSTRQLFCHQLEQKLT